MRGSQGSEGLTKRADLQKLIQVRNTLKEGADACRRVLQELGKLELEDRLRTFDKVFQEVLKRMGKALYEASLLVSEEGAGGLYFWPGYDSILKPLEDSRITLDCPVHEEVQGKTTTRHIACGIEYPNATGDEPKASYTSYWFDLILLPHSEDEFDKDKFAPGSMHFWASQPDLSMVSGKDKIPLNIIEIAISESQAMQAGSGDDREQLSDPDYGAISIILDKGHSEKWGEDVARVLNNPQNTDSPFLWPYPYPPSTPFTDSEQITAQAKVIHMTRLCLYNLWLAANFDPEGREDCWRWMHDFRFEEEGKEEFRGSFLEFLRGKNLSQLADRIEKAYDMQGGRPRSIQGLSARQYRYWYVLILERTPAISTLQERESLGSVMFLSSHKIDKGCLMLMKFRMEWIYLLMRYFEGATLLEQKGRSNIGHRLPGTLGSMVYSLEQQRHYLKEEYGATFNIPPQYHILYMASSLEQGFLPRWEYYEDQCRVDDGSRYVLKGSVLREIWEGIAKPVGQFRVRTSREGLYRENWSKVTKDPILHIPEAQIELASEYDCAALLSFCCPLLLEAYQHAWMWSVLEYVEKGYSEHAKVEVTLQRDSITITNPVPRKTNTDRIKLQGGSQLQEITKIEQLVRTLWEVEYPKNEETLRHGDPWIVKIKRAGSKVDSHD